MGAAVAVGQDGLLPRCHARLAPARLRAAPARHPPRPRPAVRAPLRAPPRRGRHTVPILPPGRARPGAGVRLPVLPRRPARRLRRARPAHPRRVHGVRGRRRVLVGGGAERRSVCVLRASQGRGRATVPHRAAGEGRGRTGAHALAVPLARGRAPRRGVQDQLPRAPPFARLQDRRRGRTPERRPPNTERAEAV